LRANFTIPLILTYAQIKLGPETVACADAKHRPTPKSPRLGKIAMLCGKGKDSLRI